MIYKKVISLFILSMICIFSFVGCSQKASESAINEKITQEDADQEMSSSYDEYEFVERDTDLDNGVDTFYYEATQVEGLITSKYDVALTYQFEMGEWNAPDIQETLTETKWDVIGTWKYEDETKIYDVI